MHDHSDDYEDTNSLLDPIMFLLSVITLISLVLLAVFNFARTVGFGILFVLLAGAAVAMVVYYYDQISKY